MATNADFDSLIARITTATNTLEVDVANINAGSTNVAEAVAQAEQAADDAQSYATQAQDEVEQLLALQPLLKGEYGEPVNFTTNPVFDVAADFEDSYGKLYKLKIGATGVELNTIPDALIQGWHLYVFNATGADITISGTATIGGSFLIGDGHIARINTDTDNDFFVYDITSAAPAGGVFRETTLLLGTSALASQLPSGLDTPFNITFGAAQGTVADPVQLGADGAITFNQAGQYIINYISHYGRTGSGGIAKLFTRSTINGVTVGTSRTASLPTADTLNPFALRVKIDVNVGDVLRLQLIRDSSGVNDGGFFEADPVTTGFTNAPSAQIEVARLEGTIDSTEGVSTFIELLDVPGSYTGQAGKAVVVRGDEVGLEFVEVSGAVDSVNGQTGVVVLDAADVGAKESTYVPDWTEITSKPTTFAPSAHVHSASDITSGVMATARLGTGTADATTVLLGNGTWGSAPAGATPNFGATLGQETPLKNMVNKMSDGSVTFATIKADLASGGMSNGGMAVVDIVSSSFNPLASTAGRGILTITFRGDGSGGISELTIFFEYMTGAAVGKKYFCKRFGDSAGTWTVIDATA
jgi:hypothetical protein